MTDNPAPDNIEIAHRAFRAYADDDREALEAIIAPDFHFTSPYDNRIDRQTYFERCWPNHKHIADMRFIRSLCEGDVVAVTYEGTGTGGQIFRNTEVLMIRDGKIVEVEVYFGWNIPHKAEAGGFIDPAGG